MALLGALRFQKLASGGRVEEQVTHFDRGALRVGGRLERHLPTAIHFDPHGLLGARLAGGDGQASNRCHAGKRFAAKTQARHPIQIISSSDLAGRVAGNRQTQVIRMDPGAIVANEHPFHATHLGADVDARRGRVETVLNQLFDERCRALHHFAGGDLVGNHVR